MSWDFYEKGTTKIGQDEQVAVNSSTDDSSEICDIIDISDSRVIPCQNKEEIGNVKKFHFYEDI